MVAFRWYGLVGTPKEQHEQALRMREEFGVRPNLDKTGPDGIERMETAAIFDEDSRDRQCVKSGLTN
jgi:hypothetical protein